MATVSWVSRFRAWLAAPSADATDGTTTWTISSCCDCAKRGPMATTPRARPARATRYCGTARSRSVQLLASARSAQRLEHPLAQPVAVPLGDVVEAHREQPLGAAGGHQPDDLAVQVDEALPHVDPGGRTRGSPTRARTALRRRPGRSRSRRGEGGRSGAR